jgi:hypothetical protein
LYGLEAIAHHNGWAISILGVSIVFTGLVSLALIISQLYKVLDFWDNRKTHIKNIKTFFKNKDISEKTAKKKILPAEIDESADHYRLLIGIIGEPFSLPKLIELAESRGLPHSHSTINKFLKDNIIVPDNQGFFMWKQ